MTTEATRYRECLAALERATGNHVTRLEWDLSDPKRPQVIATASTKEDERALAELGVTVLRLVYSSHGSKTIGEPHEEPIEEGEP